MTCILHMSETFNIHMAVLYNNTRPVVIGKLLLFHIVLSQLYCCVAHQTLYINIFCHLGVFANLARQLDC